MEIGKVKKLEKNGDSEIFLGQNIELRIEKTSSGNNNGGISYSLDQNHYLEDLEFLQGNECWKPN